MRRVLSTLAALTVFLTMPLAAWAKPSVVVTMSSSREFVATVGGKEVRKVLPAKSVGPGQTIKYTLKYHNQGDEKATNVVINNPVPKDTVYVMGSAAGADSEITFSIDGGKSFKQPTLLSYETTGPNGQVTQKQASPEQYTHVQWIVKEVLPGQEGEVSFQVKVK